MGCSGRTPVVFKRFTYAASASMTVEWKARKSAEWSAAHCSSPLWGEAIGRVGRLTLV
jgi:hypothetical protein